MEDWLINLIIVALYCASILGGISILGYTGFKIVRSIEEAKKKETEYKMKLLETHLKEIIDNNNDHDLIKN